MNTRLITFAFKQTLPIMLGYVPIGFAFGVLFTDLGYSWIYAFLMGLLVFAGSSQLLATGMLAMGESIVEIGLMTVLLNSRQGFFGIPLLKEYQTVWWKKLYLIFTLSDEPFSIISTTKIPEEFDKHTAYMVLNMWMHFYWTLGCTLGGLAGGSLPFSTDGMEFALTGMFLVLTIDQYRMNKTIPPFLIAMSVGILALIFVPKTHMLLTSITISIAYILAKGKQSQWKL